MDLQQAATRGFGLRVFHHHGILGRDVGEDGVFVRAGLDAVLREERFRHAGEVRLGELQRRLRLGDVRPEIRALLFDQLPEALDFVAFRLRQSEAGSAVGAERFLKELLVFAFELRIRLRVGLHGGVNILTVIERHHPVLDLLDRLGRCIAEADVQGGLLGQTQSVRREGCAPKHVVEGEDRVLQRDLRWLEFSDGVESGVALGDGRVGRHHDGIGRGLELGKQQPILELCRDGVEVGERLGGIGRGAHGIVGRMAGGQCGGDGHEHADLSDHGCGLRRPPDLNQSGTWCNGEKPNRCFGASLTGSAFTEGPQGRPEARAPATDQASP